MSKQNQTKSLPVTEQRLSEQVNKRTITNRCVPIKEKDTWDERYTWESGLAWGSHGFLSGVIGNGLYVYISLSPGA